MVTSRATLLLACVIVLTIAWVPPSEGATYTIQALLPISSASDTISPSSTGQPSVQQLNQWRVVAEQALTTINSDLSALGVTLVMDILDTKGQQARNLELTFQACTNTSVSLIIHGGPDALTTDTANLARFYNVRTNVLFRPALLSRFSALSLPALICQKHASAALRSLSDGF